MGRPHDKKICSALAATSWMAWGSWSSTIVCKQLMQWAYSANNAIQHPCPRWRWNMTHSMKHQLVISWRSLTHFYYTKSPIKPSTMSFSKPQVHQLTSKQKDDIWDGTTLETHLSLLRDPLLILSPVTQMPLFLFLSIRHLCFYLSSMSNCFWAVRDPKCSFWLTAKQYKLIPAVVIELLHLSLKVCSWLGVIMNIPLHFHQLQVPVLERNSCWVSGSNVIEYI